jgi:predicted Fe-Mo cluster-binding NifX family protein
MRIAIPLTGGQLAGHFGHCEKFAFADVDLDAKAVTALAEVEAPEHQPGLLPAWLKLRGVTLVIAGGMGPRASSRFAAESIQVVTGAPALSAPLLIELLLDGKLESGANACDHGTGDCRSGGRHAPGASCKA